MGTVFAWSIPLSVLLMIGLGVFETLRHRHRKRRGAPVTATYINEFTAMFYGTKRMEFEHRDSMSMMRDDDAQGAPPRSRIDLDSGVAYLSRAGKVP